MGEVQSGKGQESEVTSPQAQVLAKSQNGKLISTQYQPALNPTEPLYRDRDHGAAKATAH
jgi:hypothetical protein